MESFLNDENVQLSFVRLSGENYYMRIRYLKKVCVCTECAIFCFQILSLGPVV